MRRYRFHRGGIRKRSSSRSRVSKGFRNRRYGRRSSTKFTRPRRYSRTITRKRFSRTRRAISKRRRTSLKSSSYGPINRIFKYRNSNRRAYRISKKFQKKVDIAQGHTLLYEAHNNSYGIWANGTCQFQTISMGLTSANQIYTDFCLENWQNYQSPDSAVTLHSPQQFALKIKVLDARVFYQGFNAGNSKFHVTVYPLRARRDIYDTDLLPVNIFGTSTLKPDVTTLQAVDSISRNLDDPTNSPYDWPAFTQNYVIGKSRSFVVHAGGHFNLSLRHSWDIKVGTDTNYGWAGQIGSSKVPLLRKHAFRGLLIKYVGELGVSTNADNVYKLIRNLPGEVAGKSVSKIKLHVAEETRPIKLTINLAADRTNAGGTSYKVNEETNVVGEIIDIADITSEV